MHDIGTRHEDQVVARSAFLLCRGSVSAKRSEQTYKRLKSRVLTNAALRSYRLIRRPRCCCGGHSHCYRKRCMAKSSRHTRDCDNDMLGMQQLLPLSYDRELEPYI